MDYYKGEGIFMTQLIFVFWCFTLRYYAKRLCLKDGVTRVGVLHY